MKLKQGGADHPAKQGKLLVLTDKQRQKVIRKLSTAMSDNEIAEKCGVSRSTVWRIRQDEAAKEAKRKRALARMRAKEKKAPAEQTQPQLPTTPITVPPPPAPTPEVEPVLPKVDAEPVQMVHYFAVQVLRGESVKDVAYAVMKAAETEGILFRKLQTLDCISVGTTPFARFRSDLGDIAAVLRRSNRGYISFADSSYRVTFSDGRQVKYPATVMLSVQKSGFGHQYAGPKILRWSQQFGPRTN